MSIVSATGFKPSREAKVGISFSRSTVDSEEGKNNSSTIVVITKIAEDGIFANTALQEGFQVVEINGTSVEDMSPSEAIGIVKNAEEGEINIRARDRSGQTAPEMSIVSATGFKPSREAKVGISFSRSTVDSEEGKDNSSTIVVITKIAEDGIFANTALQEGFEVVEINGTSVEDMSPSEAIGIIKEAKEGEVEIRARERYGKTAIATITKDIADMKVGMVFEGDAGVQVKEIADTSPFKGKLPWGPEYQVAPVNGIPVQTMDANHVKGIIDNTREGPLTITMEKVSSPASTGAPSATAGPPPGLPEGGRWGRVKYVGPSTACCALLGCFCFGVPGLCILCCPFDERDVYLAPNERIYEADGKRSGESIENFTGTRPTGQTMKR